MSAASSIRVAAAVVLGASLSMLAGSGSGCASKSAEDEGGASWDLACEVDEAVTQASGAQSGWSRCDDSLPHRVEAAQCEVPDPPETCEAIGGGEGDCTTSADCTARPFGACLDNERIDQPGCECVYSCETDADCGDGQICSCLGLRPRCIDATACETDADCGEGLCIARSIAGGCGGVTTTMVCIQPDDECRPDLPETCPEVQQCSSTAFVRAPCVFTNRGWSCGELECGTSCG